MKTCLLEEMTWPEIREAMDQGFDTVIIYAASIEQHGPALPESTDLCLGYAEAADLAVRLGHALVAPVIRPGLSKHHMGFPGSVTLRPEVFRGVVEDYVAAYVHHGFRRIILGASHGGNFSAMDEIAAGLARRYPDVCIVTGCCLDELDASLIELEKMEGLPHGTCGGHACDWETSIMMMLDADRAAGGPGDAAGSADGSAIDGVGGAETGADRTTGSAEYDALGFDNGMRVRADRLQTGFMGGLSGETLRVFFEEGVQAISPIGVMGDPTGSNAGRGRRYFKYMQDVQETAVRKHIREWEMEH